MTSRLRAMADRAEKVQGQREAWQRMEASVRERQILDLQDMSPDDIIEAARAIHSGDDDGWLPRVEASLADAEARWEAGERPRCADARGLIEAEARYGVR